MTENEAIKDIQFLARRYDDLQEVNMSASKESLDMAIQALEEIQQYRAYKEIFESHFSKEALELLSDKAEFGKWLERGKWIAKKCDEINRKLESFEAIGTVEEFKALKEKMQDVEIAIIDRMQEFYDEYRSISQSSVDHFGGKADAIETSQRIVKGVFKDILGIDWNE